MRKNALTICCCSGVMAAFGAFFRWLQNQVCFEEDTGLAVSGSVWPYVVALWIAAAAVILAVLCLRLKNQARLRLPETFAEAFAGENGLYAACAWALGALMILGGILLLFAAAGSSYAVLHRVLALLAIAAGAGFPLQLRAVGPEEEPPAAAAAFATLPIMLFAFWLIVSYKVNIVNPAVSSYAVEILALSAATIGFYQIAGYAFGRVRPARAVFFCQFGAFLCLTTLSDGRYTGQQLILVAAAGMLLFQSWLVMANVRPITAAPDSE